MDDEIIISDNNSEVSDPLSRVLPENIKEFRNKILKYTPPKVDKFGDGFLAKAYLVAKNSPTGSMRSIRKELNLDELTFQYYMDKYSDFATAIQIGLYDSRKEKIQELESSLMAKALGMEIEEEKTEESGAIDEDGNTVKAFRKTTVTKKQVPPDTQAIITLLQKIDPSYNPKAVLDVNFNQTLNVTEDVNINVDYRTLSTSAIKELLASNKQEVNNEINKTPDGKSVRFLGEQGRHALDVRNEKRTEYNARKKLEKEEAEKNVDPNTVVKKRVMSDETKRKISEALKKKYHKEDN